MPTLANAKYEAMALALFKGMTADAAYEAAGYKRHRGNAARLSADESIRGRVAELQAEAAKKATDDVSFEAKAMFQRLERRIEAAANAGDHKSAIDGTKFLIACFGYEDSPTLTHEHVAGTKLPSEGAPPLESEGNVVQLTPNRRFEKLMTKLARARG